MRVHTNVSALRAQRSMSEHNKQIENASGKISSGTRVRTAADDAASLSIGNKQKSNIRSQSQAIRNANDAISHFQVAEGAMNEIGNILVRLREISVQAASGTYSDNERGHLNIEYMQLRREAERIAQSAQFMSTNVLHDTSGYVREFVVGIRNNNESKVSLEPTELAVTEFNLGIVDSSVVNQEEARINIKHIDDAITRLSAKRALAGSYQSRIQSAAANLETSHLNESTANSKNMDADIAYETAEKLRSENKLQAASSVLAQSSSISAMALKLLKD